MASGTEKGSSIFPQSIWANPLLKKWFSLTSPGNDFVSDARVKIVTPRDASLKSSSAKSLSKQNLASPSEGSESSKRGDASPPHEQQLTPWLKISGFREELESARKQFMEKVEIKVVAATWNVAGLPPSPDVKLRDWLRMNDHPHADIYLLSFQEVVPLTANSVLGVDYDAAGHAWNAKVRETLNPEPVPEEAPLEGSGQEGGYVLVASKQMVGLHVCVWVRAGLRPCVGPTVRVHCVPCGLLGVVGNKGSAAVSLRVHATWLCCVGVHLSAGERAADAEKRRADWAEVMGKTRFKRREEEEEEEGQGRWEEQEDEEEWGGKVPETVAEHDCVIVVGDLNSRLDLPDEVVRRHLAQGELAELQQHDQFVRELQSAASGTGTGGGSLLLRGWQEAALTFPPTYKYCLHSRLYVGEGDTGENGEEWGDKKRTPAWCDRVLFRGGAMAALSYTRTEITASDHRPVSAVLALQADRWTPGGWPRALEAARRQLDEREERMRPRARLAVLRQRGEGLAGAEEAEEAEEEEEEGREVSFGQLSYCQPVVRTVMLHNTGQVDLHFHAATSAGDATWHHRWLTLDPAHACVTPGASLALRLTAMVVAPHACPTELPPGDRLPASGLPLGAVCVVGLEGGGDLFLPCSASYTPSCWGLSLESLVRMPVPVRHLAQPPDGAASQGGASSSGAPPPGDAAVVPKEFLRLLSYLADNAPAPATWRSAFDTAAVGIVEAEEWGALMPPPDASSAPFSSLVSWEGQWRVLEGRVQPIREALDTGEELPAGTTCQLAATALVMMLRALPQPVLPHNVTNAVDSGAGLEALEGIGALERALLEAVLEVARKVLEGQPGNQFAIRETAAVLASALFPQQPSVEKRLFRCRTRFLRGLIEERLLE